ncbi:MAG: hypothetical protein V1929_10760 [bacterium]
MKKQPTDQKRPVEKQRHAGGRPPKFKEPSRPITVTLPDRTLDLLATIDADRAKAIVKATNAALPDGKSRNPMIEVVHVLPGIGIILVGPSRYLRKIAWLHLVEVAPQRFLLVLPTNTAPDTLEIELIDLLETIPESETREHAMIKELQSHLRSFRQSRKVSKAEILFVKTAR